MQTPISQTESKSEGLNLLFVLVPVGNFLMLLIALSTFWGLPQGHLSTVLQGWIFIAAGGSLAWLFLWYLYHRNPDWQSPTQWRRQHRIIIALMGLLWSGMYLLMPASAEMGHQGALFLLYFGIMLSGFGLLLSDLKGFLVYTVPATLSFEWILWRSDGRIYGLFTITVALIYLMMWVVGRHSQAHRQYKQDLELRNASLIEQLQHEVENRDGRVKQQTQALTALNTALKHSEQRLKNVLIGANLGYWDWDYQTGRHTVNDRWLEMLGLSRDDIKHTVDDWDERIHPGDRERMVSVIERCISERTGYVEEFRMLHKDGHWVWIQGSGAVVEFGEQGEPIRLSGTHQEISERKTQEQHLTYRANHDALTGLLNRTALWDFLEDEISRATRHRRDLSLFVVDIDHFKRINDQYGHKAGDLVLQQFADLLRDSVRREDRALRYGGEEFVVILPDTDSPAACGLGERIRQKIEDHQIETADQVIRFTISIGVASYPADAMGAKELFDAADKAMYQAKNSGRNRVCSAAT